MFAATGSSRWQRHRPPRPSAPCGLLRSGRRSARGTRKPVQWPGVPSRRALVRVRRQPARAEAPSGAGGGRCSWAARRRSRPRHGVVLAVALGHRPFHDRPDPLPNATRGLTLRCPDRQQHLHEVGGANAVDALAADLRDGVVPEAGAPLGGGLAAVLPVLGVYADDCLDGLFEGRCATGPITSRLGRFIEREAITSTIAFLGSMRAPTRNAEELNMLCYQTVK